MKNKKKQFLVIGLGRFGSSVAKTLAELNYEVMAIDQDEDAVNDISPFVTQAVVADASDDQVLADLDAGSFDAAVVSIGADGRDSILISMLCKEAGIPLVIAKATDDRHAKILRRVGVDRVIFPERDGGARLARSLVAPNVLDMMDLPDGYQIAEVAAPASWIGKTLMQLNVRRVFGLSVIAIRHSTKLEASPAADSRIEACDALVVLGKQDDIDALERK